MISKDFLEIEYINNDRSAKDIGKEIGKSDTQVRYWLKKHGIPIKPRGCRHKALDLTNKQFNDLIPIKLDATNKNGTYWICECVCGNLTSVQKSSLITNDIKSCGKCKEHYKWSGVGYFSGHQYATIKHGAKIRNIVFEISKEYLWQLYLKQDKKCALTGEFIYFERNNPENKKIKTASLDRIDSLKGYTEDNVQWVHKDINRFKREYSKEFFLELVEKVYKYNF